MIIKCARNKKKFNSILNDSSSKTSIYHFECTSQTKQNPSDWHLPSLLYNFPFIHWIMTKYPKHTMYSNPSPALWFAKLTSLTIPPDESSREGEKRTCRLIRGWWSSLFHWYSSRQILFHCSFFLLQSLVPPLVCDLTLQEQHNHHLHHTTILLISCTEQKQFTSEKHKSILTINQSRWSTASQDLQKLIGWMTRRPTNGNSTSHTSPRFSSLIHVAV